jgi:uncharacterized membrane protein
MRSSAAAFVRGGERPMMPSNWWIFPLVMPLVMVVVAFLMMRMMRGAFFPGHRTQHSSAGSAAEELHDGDNDRALSILRQRYAGGEIELEEYERRVEPLLRHEPRKKLS